MANELASVTDRIQDLLAALGGGASPDRRYVDDTLTDGYAWALTLDAECARLERSIADLATSLANETSEARAHELSVLAGELVRAKREHQALRNLLASLRAEASQLHARVA
jgi:hypothetical protein